MSEKKVTTYPKQKVGRPRTTTPNDEELIELGKKLVTWATEETVELRCRFCQWYSLENGILDKQWELMVAKPEFQGYYEQARVALSKRFLDGTIKEGIAHRFLRIYCPEVKQTENEKAEFESKLREKENQELGKTYVFREKDI